MNQFHLPSPRGLGLAFILIVGAFGCAAGGPRPPTPTEIAGREAKVIIVAPLNVASSLPVEIEGSSKIVSTTLVGYLEEHGKKVQMLGYQVGRDLWVNATQQVSKSGKRRSFEAAASVYAHEIAKHVDYDVLIIPTLYIQNVRVQSMNARWDGTKETIRVEGKDILSKKDYAVDGLRANVKAASMMAAVFASDGSEIQSAKRGLQMIEHVEILGKKRRNRDVSDDHIDIKANSPPLDDALKIRAGIAHVLSPFLPIREAVEVRAEAEGTEPE